MALTNYKVAFDNAYEDTFQKVTVGKAIANGRFMSELEYGQSIERVAYDISAVRVRSVTRSAASTIDTVLDTPEYLTINLEKEAVFHISDGEVKQAGPLNPGEVIGGQVAVKVAIDFDARIFAEVRNAAYKFDSGDLTTGASTGVPITLSATTVPQMVTRMPAKLRKNNQTLGNLAFVIDSYGASDVAQYLLGKQYDVVDSIFKNGMVDGGSIGGGQMYISENLTGEFTGTAAGVFSDGELIVINGVTLTMKSTLGATPGQVLIGANAAASLTNIAGIINSPGTTNANQVALSSADQLTFTDTLKLTATATATTVNVVGVGAGRMTVSETGANFSFSTAPFIHAYFGKKGSIDYVMWLKEVDMRPTSDRRGTNVFSSYLAGIKTFTDGAKKFEDVWVLA